MSKESVTLTFSPPIAPQPPLVWLQLPVQYYRCFCWCHQRSSHHQFQWVFDSRQKSFWICAAWAIGAHSPSEVLYCWLPQDHNFFPVFMVTFMNSLSLSSPINALPNSLLLYLPSLGNPTHIVGFRNFKYGDNALNSSSSPDLWHNLPSHPLSSNTSNSNSSKEEPILPWPSTPLNPPS